MEFSKGKCIFDFQFWKVQLQSVDGYWPLPLQNTGYIACKIQVHCYLYLFQMKSTSVSLSSSSYITELSLDGFKQTGLSSVKCNEILL